MPPSPRSALAHEWSGKCYAFPPRFLAWPTVEKALASPLADITLILPDWPSQGWYPLLLERCDPELDCIALGPLDQCVENDQDIESGQKDIPLLAWRLRSRHE